MIQSVFFWSVLMKNRPTSLYTVHLQDELFFFSHVVLFSLDRAKPGGQNLLGLESLIFISKWNSDKVLCELCYDFATGQIWSVCLDLEKTCIQHWIRCYTITSTLLAPYPLGCPPALHKVNNTPAMCSETQSDVGHNRAKHMWPSEHFTGAINEL